MIVSKLVSEYDQEIPQSQNASRGTDTKESQDTKKTNKAKQGAQRLSG